VNTVRLLTSGPQRLAEHPEGEPTATQYRLRGSCASPQAVPDRRTKQRTVVRRLRQLCRQHSL
jgi:hypothetical protein